jgi:ferredoxin
MLVERADARGLPLAAMIKDDERCIRCGLCAIRCPTDAMSMERFTITERLVVEDVAGGMTEPVVQFSVQP